MSDLRFMRFVGKEIFPGGQIPSAEDVVEFSPARDSQWMSFKS